MKLVVQDESEDIVPLDLDETSLALSKSTQAKNYSHFLQYQEDDLASATSQSIALMSQRDPSLSHDNNRTTAPTNLLDFPFDILSSILCLLAAPGNATNGDGDDCNNCDDPNNNANGGEVLPIIFPTKFKDFGTDALSSLKKARKEASAAKVDSQGTQRLLSLLFVYYFLSLSLSLLFSFFIFDLIAFHSSHSR
jgi:hypothetical protein